MEKETRRLLAGIFDNSLAEEPNESLEEKGKSDELTPKADDTSQKITDVKLEKGEEEKKDEIDETPPPDIIAEGSRGKADKAGPDEQDKQAEPSETDVAAERAGEMDEASLEESGEGEADGDTQDSSDVPKYVDVQTTETSEPAEKEQHTEVASSHEGGPHSHGTQTGQKSSKKPKREEKPPKKRHITVYGVICLFLNLIVCVLLAVCLMTGVYAARQIQGNLKIRDENEKLAQEEQAEKKKRQDEKKAAAQAKLTGNSTVDTAVARKIDFAKLKKTDPLIAGWISIPGTGTDHALSYGETEDYTKLKTGGDENTEDGVFISSRSSSGLTDANTLIQGRSSGFETLSTFSSGDSINQNPYVFIYLPDGEVNIYRIFAEMPVNTVSQFYRYVQVPSVDNMRDYMKSLRSKCISFDSAVGIPDKMLTLMNYGLESENSASSGQSTTYDQESSTGAVAQEESGFVTMVNGNSSRYDSLSSSSSSSSSESAEDIETTKPKSVTGTPKGIAVFAKKVTIKEIKERS